MKTRKRKALQVTPDRMWQALEKALRLFASKQYQQMRMNGELNQYLDNRLAEVIEELSERSQAAITQPIPESGLGRFHHLEGQIFALMRLRNVIRQIRDQQAAPNTLRTPPKPERPSMVGLLDLPTFVTRGSKPLEPGSEEYYEKIQKDIQSSTWELERQHKETARLLKKPWKFSDMKSLVTSRLTRSLQKVRALLSR